MKSQILKKKLVIKNDYIYIYSEGWRAGGQAGRGRLTLSSKGVKTADRLSSVKATVKLGALNLKGEPRSRPAAGSRQLKASESTDPACD